MVDSRRRWRISWMAVLEVVREGRRLMMTCWACSEHDGLVEKTRMMSCEAFDSGYEQ